MGNAADESKKSLRVILGMAAEILRESLRMDQCKRPKAVSD
jgi:hypothetical protein